MLAQLGQLKKGIVVSHLWCVDNLAKSWDSLNLELCVLPVCTGTKGNNFCDFLFASLDNKTLLKWGLLLKEYHSCAPNTAELQWLKL